MLKQIVATEWRNNNERVRYPFVDTATLTDVDEAVTLDEDLFSDARLYPIGGEAGVFLRNINVDQTIVTFTIAGPNVGDLASGAYDATAAPGEVALYDDFDRPAGILVSTAVQLAALADQLPQGDTTFEAGTTEFVASAVVPLPHTGVRGLLLDDGEIVSGDVWLVGEDGVVLSFEGGAIRVDVIGDPYALLKDCEDQNQPLPVFCGIKTINNIPPDAQGDFKLLVGGNLAEDPILRIETSGDGRVVVKLVGTETVRGV